MSGEEAAEREHDEVASSEWVVDHQMPYRWI